MYWSDSVRIVCVDCRLLSKPAVKMAISCTTTHCHKLMGLSTGFAHARCKPKAINMWHCYLLSAHPRNDIQMTCSDTAGSIEMITLCSDVGVDIRSRICTVAVHWCKVCRRHEVSILVKATVEGRTPQRYELLV